MIRSCHDSVFLVPGGPRCEISRPIINANLCCALFGLTLAVRALAANPAPPVVPNRTLPKVDPPTTELSFSVSPTVQELFRARVFAAISFQISVFGQGKLEFQFTSPANAAFFRGASQ